MVIDPHALPKDVDLLHQMVVELCEQLQHETAEKDPYRILRRELLEAQRNRKSEQLSKDQRALFETRWKAGHPEQNEEEDPEPAVEEEQKPEGERCEFIPAGMKGIAAVRAVRDALHQWEALTRFLEDGDLDIDHGATERGNRDLAIGPGNGTFFASDKGGKTAAVVLSFIARCKRNPVEPFPWFRDVLSRITTHPINRIQDLLPHNWKPLATAAQT